MTIMTALAVPTLTMLASEINDAHRQAQAHAKGMLLEAKRAGDALLQAKKEIPHGQFKAWVEANTSVSYSTAAVYMKVAKEWDQKSSMLDFSTTSLRDFIGNKPKKSKHPPFTKDDAEYAQKLHAMATRGGTENEREVAQVKLESFAKSFGKTAEEIVGEAEKVSPTPQSTTPEQRGREALKYMQVAKCALRGTFDPDLWPSIDGEPERRMRSLALTDATEVVCGGRRVPDAGGLPPSGKGPRQRERCPEQAGRR